ncbi:hypothetical protein AVEN_130683-1, partial [Araneus ventricosus]
VAVHYRKKCSTFDRELLSIYLSVKHFRYMLENIEVVIYTDHKPLVFAFTRKHDISTPRQGVYSDTPGWVGFRTLTTESNPTPNPTGGARIDPYIRYLELISQFTTDIRYTAGRDNVVADTVS